MAVIGMGVAFLIALFFLRLVYSRACLHNLDVDLSISALTATEGDALTLTEIIKNRKWLPLPWLGVRFKVSKELEFADSEMSTVSDAYYRNDMFHILMHQKITRRLNFTCTKRGYYNINGLEITGWDILMENKYIRTCENDISLTVYPSTIEAPVINNLCTYIYGHLNSRLPIYTDPFSFRGIREYLPHDPMKAINFKASAKAQSLMVNVQDFSNARQIVLMLDIERHAAWHNESIDERAIKLAASFAEKMTAEGVPLRFITNGKSVRSGSDTNLPQGRGAHHLRAILESLAYINLSAENLESFEHILDKQTQNGEIEPEYWLITAYYEKNVEAAYLRLKETGARAVWIMPKPKSLGLDVLDEIIFA